MASRSRNEKKARALSQHAQKVRDMKRQLLALSQWATSDVNGVPVRRIPCAGVYFEVGVCEDGAGMTRKFQMLRLSDAISRCLSGHFPRVRPASRESDIDTYERMQAWLKELHAYEPPEDAEINLVREWEKIASQAPFPILPFAYTAACAAALHGKPKRR